MNDILQIFLCIVKHGIKPNAIIIAYIFSFATCFYKRSKIFFSRGSAAALDVESGGDYMVASDILDLDTREKMADNGAKQICGMVERMDMTHVVERL